MEYFNGLHLNMGNISRLSKAKTRSITAENFKGEKGAGGMSTDGVSWSAAQDLGQGWKVSPCINLEANSVTTLAEIDGPGAIQHIWITTYSQFLRSLILRFYWDDEETPSIEVPMGDFFCNGWTEYCHVNSLPISANPHTAFNSYWEMPFRKSAHVTIENLLDKPVRPLFYQFDYTLTDVPEDVGYLHAQWRRNNPLPYKEVHTILDGVKGMGHYVGTYMAWGSNNRGWWARAKSSSSWTAMATSPRSAAPAPKTTSAVPGVLAIKLANTASSQRPIWDCPKSSSPMASIRANSASASTAGISQTRSALKKTCASRCRRSVGATGHCTKRPLKNGAIWLCKTTSPPPPFGIRQSPTRPSPFCRTGTISKSSSLNELRNRRSNLRYIRQPA